MRFLLLSLATGSFLLLAASAHAGDCGGDKSATTAAQEIFEKADSNGDGALSPAEYSEAGMQRFGVGFDEYDLDANGEASLEEYLELFERHHSGATDLEA